jgi:DNA-directed RNA polymerase specialized sigma24 family protein
MANSEAWNRVSSTLPPPLPPGGEPDIEEMFRARYQEMVRLAGLLGADDPEDIAQEAFLRLMKAGPRIEDRHAALP